MTGFELRRDLRPFLDPDGRFAPWDDQAVISAAAEVTGDLAHTRDQVGLACEVIRSLEASDRSQLPAFIAGALVGVVLVLGLVVALLVVGGMS